jgi:hypothetical protein
MASPVEHPDIRFVVYPVHIDGTRTGAKPRLRHYQDCGHFEWPGGVRLGTPEPATFDQMRSLKACKTCIASRGGPARDGRLDLHQSRTGTLCPGCNQLLPLTGVCDTCAE